MSKVCELTGKSVRFGNKVSHSNRKSRRRFEPNLHHVSLYSDILKKFVSLRLSSQALRTVDFVGGLDVFLLKSKAANLAPEAQKLRRDLKKATAKAA